MLLRFLARFRRKEKMWAVLLLFPRGRSKFSSPIIHLFLIKFLDSCTAYIWSIYFSHKIFWFLYGSLVIHLFLSSIFLILVQLTYDPLISHIKFLDSYTNAGCKLRAMLIILLDSQSTHILPPGSFLRGCLDPVTKI